MRTVVVVLLALVAVAGAGAEPQEVELSLKGGQLPKEQRLVRVRQGDDVTLRWTTDRAVTVHLHGYDLEEKLTSGAQVSMRFTARATGRFPLEVHERGGHRTVGYLEVHPR